MGLGEASHLVVCSRAIPFATVFASDFGGPRSRQRLFLRERELLPHWLGALLSGIPEGEDVIAVAGGRSKPGTTIRITAIVTYPATHHAPETTYVYVEEAGTGARLAERPAPVHVIRCRPLPGDVRFVEVARAWRRTGEPHRRATTEPRLEPSAVSIPRIAPTRSRSTPSRRPWMQRRFS
jgi:hypothetical protein